MNKKVRILIIEDDEDDFILASDLLKEVDPKKYEIKWAKTSFEALDSLSSDSFDVALVDHNLGHITGIDIITKAKEIGVKLPFIMLTGQKDDATDINALLAGAADFLVKNEVTSQILSRSIRYTIEQNKILEELKNQEEKYKGLFNSIRDSILVVDINRNIIDCNPAFTKLFGYSITDIKGKKPTVIYSNKSEYLKIGEILKKTDTKSYLPLIQFSKKNKEKFPGEVTYYTLRESNGNKIGYIGMVRDITQRLLQEKEKEAFEIEKAARSKAEAVLERLQFLSEATNIISSSLDYQQILKNVAQLLVPKVSDWCSIDLLEDNNTLNNTVIEHKDNKKIFTLKEIQKKYPPDPKSKIGIYEVIRSGHPLIYSTLNPEIIKNLSQNEEHFSLQTSLKICSLIIVPLKGREKTFGVMSLMNSSSNRYFNSEDLLLAEEIAQKVSLAIDNSLLYEKAKTGIRIRDEFLNIASHELKTPLTSLQLQLQILMKNYHQEPSLTSDKLLSMLDSSERQVKRLSQLINNLLDVSRISSKNLELVKETVNLIEVVNDVTSRFEQAISLSGSELRIVKQKKIIGYWDRFRIDQVITNLLSNALKYGQGKPITLDINLENDVALVKIKDRGIGIEESNLQKIFDRFERTETARQYGGLGLGLYIVKQIVEAHEGKISVKSKVNYGSEFTIRLPLS